MRKSLLTAQSFPAMTLIPYPAAPQIRPGSGTGATAADAPIFWTIPKTPVRSPVKCSSPGAEATDYNSLINPIGSGSVREPLVNPEHILPKLMPQGGLLWQSRKIKCLKRNFRRLPAVLNPRRCANSGAHSVRMPYSGVYKPMFVCECGHNDWILVSQNV